MTDEERADKIEAVAEAAYGAVRAYLRGTGERAPLSWENASWPSQKAARDRVVALLGGSAPDLTPKTRAAHTLDDVFVNTVVTMAEALGVAPESEMVNGLRSCLAAMTDPGVVALVRAVKAFDAHLLPADAARLADQAEIDRRIERLDALRDDVLAALADVPKKYLQAADSPAEKAST